jgi:ferric-dicitrate binding protein FerR (iron transport regulator)
MKSPGHFRAALMMLAIFSLAAGQNPAPQPTALPIGSATVEQLKGQVTIRSPQGSPVSAQPGTVLPAETSIETGKGSIVLDLQDGSQVQVKSQGHVVLKNPGEGKGYFLELLLGKIIAKVQKRLGNTPSFRMGTPTAVITVRGTRFSVEVIRKHKTIVEVFEGLVEVEGIGVTGPPVFIKPGFRTDVEQNRVPEQPHEIGDLGEGPGSETEREGNRLGRPGSGNDTERQGQTQGRPEHEQEKESGRPD